MSQRHKHKQNHKNILMLMSILVTVIPFSEDNISRIKCALELVLEDMLAPLLRTRLHRIFIEVNVQYVRFVLFTTVSNSTCHEL